MSNISFRESYVNGNPITRLESPAPATYNLIHNHTNRELNFGVIQSCIDAINNIRDSYSNNLELVDSLKIAADYHKRTLRVVEANRKLQEARQSTSSTSQSRRPEIYIKNEPQDNVKSEDGDFNPSPLPFLVSPPASQRGFHEHIKSEPDEEDVKQPLSPQRLSHQPSQSESQSEGVLWRLCYSVNPIRISRKSIDTAIVDITQRLGATLEAIIPGASQGGLYILMEERKITITINIGIPFWLEELPEGVQRPRRQYGPDLGDYYKVKAAIESMFAPSASGSESSEQQSQQPVYTGAERQAHSYYATPNPYEYGTSHVPSYRDSLVQSQPNLSLSEYTLTPVPRDPYSQTPSQVYPGSQGPSGSCPIPSEYTSTPVPRYSGSQAPSQPYSAMPQDIRSRQFYGMSSERPFSLRQRCAIQEALFQEFRDLKENRGEKRPAPSQPTTTTQSEATSEPSKKKIKAEEQKEDTKSEWDVFIKKEKSEDDENPS